MKETIKAYKQIAQQIAKETGTNISEFRVAHKKDYSTLRIIFCMMSNLNEQKKDAFSVAFSSQARVEKVKWGTVKLTYMELTHNQLKIQIRQA